MAGTASGSSCYATQLEAATMWCAGLSGVTPAGVITCQSLSAPLPSALDGGPVAFRWTMRLTDSAGNTTTKAITNQQLLGCEPYDFAYFSPLLAAFIAASVAILCARWVISIFYRDREAP